MVDVNTSYSNYSFHCPVINEVVNTDIRIDSHRGEDSTNPGEKVELDVVKSLEFCSGIGRCNVKTIQNNEVKYDWDICPLQSKLSRE